MSLLRNLIEIIFFCFAIIFIFTIMKKNITLLLIIFLNLNAFGQEESISFSAYNHQKDKGFLIKIFEKENDLLIEYKLADTVSDLLRKDRKYKRLLKIIKENYGQS
jgi:spermidine/putrescine-binding protein